MTRPVSYIEINSPDLPRSAAFLSAVFGWEPQPFSAADYLVAPHGDAPGVDTGLMASLDGQPRCIPVIRVPDLTTALAAVTAHGGALVVAPFTLPGIGSRCYVTDPTGVLIGLHHYDVDVGGVDVGRVDVGGSGGL